MAEVTTTRTELPEFLEAAAKPYLTELTSAVGGLKGADLSKVYGKQFVAGMDPLSTEAAKIATSTAGLGSYQPFYKLQRLLQDHKLIKISCLHIKEMLSQLLWKILIFKQQRV